MRLKLILTAAALTVLALSCGHALATEKLVLTELLELARQRNPELAAMREMAASVEAGSRAEGRLDDPTLKIELEELSTQRPLEISPGHAMLTRYTISQMFPFPGKLSLKERAASKEALSARAASAAGELEVAAMVKGAYYEYAFIDESIQVTKGIKELLSDASRIAGTMYSTGQASQQDVIKLTVEQSMLTSELITLEARREAVAASIKSLVNMNQEDPLAGEPELPRRRASFDLGKVMDAAMASAPGITVLKAEAEANELGATLAEKNYYPDFMVGVAPIQRDGRFESYDLMFQVNLPIWRGKYESLSNGAKARARAARATLEAGRNKKALEVKGAAIEVEAAEKQIELFETSIVPQSELSYESALKNYRSGAVGLMALLDTGRALKKTRTEFLKAVYEYNLRLANLERASGVELPAEAMK